MRRRLCIKGRRSEMRAMNRSFIAFNVQFAADVVGTNRRAPGLNPRGIKRALMDFAFEPGSTYAYSDSSLGVP